MDSGQTLYRHHRILLSDKVYRVDVNHAIDALEIAMTGPVQFLTMRLARYGVLLRTYRLILQCKLICLDNG